MTANASVPGWYPDPVGRFELRFHNGQVWTSDVASGGRRFIDHLAPEPTRRGGNGLGVASMVCGICAVAIGWIPFLGLLGIPAAIVALVLGIVALRRARAAAERPAAGARRGFALTGVITGAAGLAAAALGIVLTVVLVRLIDEFENPGPVDAELAPCAADDDGVVEIDGVVENLSDEERSYSVLIEVTGGRADRRLRVDVEDVPPDGEREFGATERISRGGTPSCRILGIDGPLPFGIDISGERAG